MLCSNTSKSNNLTGTESIHVLIELESDDHAIMVDDVSLAVPGTRHHLLSAVTLNTQPYTRITLCNSVSLKKLFKNLL